MSSIAGEIATDAPDEQEKPTAAPPPLQVTVDPRVELISILFRLAGNPEYNQGRVPSYTADVEKQFGPFRRHDAVRYATELRQRRGVSYDACMSLAIHVKSTTNLVPLLPLEPWPEGLDQRWTVNDVQRFLEVVGKFVQDSDFAEFLKQHRSLYELTEARLRGLVDKEAHLEWFAEYFGERPQAVFTIAPALLNGGACYGSHCREPSGKEDLYCMLGVWQTDDQGLPEFTHQMLGTIVHEFAHSYANPIVDRHWSELQQSADELFTYVSSRMRSQAYGNSQTMMRESLVRLCEVRYAFKYDGAEAGRRAIASQKSRGFLWMEELSHLFAEYELNRSKFPTVDSFAPRVARFFKEYAPEFSEQQKALNAKRPKILRMTPANGATDVDPNLGSIQVVFDRPMTDRSWSLVGGGPHCPESTGKPSYDATRTTWSVPVQLKPGWSYEFMLNSEQFDAFRSAEGIPLQPVKVRFETRKESAPSK